MGYVYSKLREKYGDFMNPRVSVLVSGKALPERLTVMKAEVSLTTAADETGSAVIEVRGNDASGELASEKLLSAFPLMAKVAVGMGYGSTVRTVFEGIVFERVIKAGGFMLGGLTVTCMDIKALLRLNNDYKNHSVKSVAALMDAVISKYGLKLNAGELPKFDKAVVFNQDGVSDYDFVADIAQNFGREFFVLNQDLYFRVPGDVKENMITLDRKALYGAEHRTSMQGAFSEARVTSYNQDGNERTEGAQSAPGVKIGKGKTAAEILKGAGYDMVLREILYNGKDLKSYAGTLIQSNSMLMTELILQMDGIPELTPGSLITVNNVMPGIDNTYYLKSARHVYDGDYRAELVCSSNTTAL